MSESIASITTAYNAARVLPRQLGALLRQTRPLQEIVVVNNASDDDTLALLEKCYPRVTILNMQSNVGAAGGWSRGLEYAALEKRHDWIWAFDDDSIPDEDALEALTAVSTGHGEKGGKIGMLALLPEHRKSGVRYPPLLWDHGFVKPSAELLKKPIWFADMAIASGLLVRRELVERIGLPRSDFFMDFFDFEYCLRARSHGYMIAVVSAAKLSHEIGDARSVRLPGFSAMWPTHPAWREYYIARNMAYAVWWLYPSRRAKRFVIGHLARHAGGVLLFGTHRLSSLNKMMQGVCDGKGARLGIRFGPS